MAKTFPFAAIVGQEEMGLALQIVAVDPTVGGVLVLGDRGTGKSTAVRALADLLPPIDVVQACPYGCSPKDSSLACDVCAELKEKGKVKTIKRPVPVVDLPLGATEDRVVGALDLEKALSQGVKSFAPGLLAQANRGFLYIDEVNLLEDHLVDLLIDVAASGENLVEREGLSWGLHTAVRGASERLPSILMTAIVTALGLVPLVIGSGEPGREIEGPMACIIVGGLLSSTLLNLLILPALLLRYGRFDRPTAQ